MSRSFLVTKFICSNCGSLLNILPKQINPASAPHDMEEPAGGIKVQSVFAIELCKCTTKPVDDFKRAFKQIIEGQ